ncbi:MAG: CRTAC1 family protein [Pirellulaceae bacterium]
MTVPKASDRIKLAITAISGCAALWLIATGCRPANENSPDTLAEASAPNNQSQDTSDDSGTTAVPEFNFSLNSKTKDAGTQAQTNESQTNIASATFELTEVQKELGISHTYLNGAEGKAMISETIGGGCGWLDFDLDGYPDLFLNQAGSFATSDLPNQPLDTLWWNRPATPGLASGFEDVTTDCRIADPYYSQGVAIADFDNDGFDDVYITNLGTNTLWKNCGDGTFLDATSTASVGDSRWGTSAAWHDLDNDGDLDLYVCNYCLYNPLAPQACLDREGRPTLCNPAELEPQEDAIFRNAGDGTFYDFADAFTRIGKAGRSLGVVAADFTNDGSPDIYVANDTTDNFLFVNDGTGQFSDEATLRGCAVDRAGGPQGSMGLAVADVDQNGFLDIYSTHFFEESNTLYANFGDLGFRDQTALVGLHQPTLDFLGFGAAFVDLNHDSLLEVMICNGHVDHSERATDPRMQPQLFTQTSSNRWTDASAAAGPFFENKTMARGLAIADYDRDGDIDLAIVSENSESSLLRNDSTAPDSSWIQIQLIGTKSNRNATGTRMKLFPTAPASASSRETPASSQKPASISTELVGGSSFASSHQRVLHTGFRGNPREVTVQIQWPAGEKQTLTLGTNQIHVLTEP